MFEPRPNIIGSCILSQFLGHLFLAMILIECKNNQVKGVYGLEMAMCQSGSHDIILGHGGHGGPSWRIAKLNLLLDELDLGP